MVRTVIIVVVLLLLRLGSSKISGRVGVLFGTPTLLVV